MARPENKQTLLAQSEKNFQQLFALIDTYPPEVRQREFPEGTLNRNIRDVLAHLYHWHQLLLGWYKDAAEGRKPSIPAAGYTWKTTPDLNRTIRDQYNNLALPEASNLLRASHQEVQALIQAHSETELFEKRYFKWTGSTSFGAYLISATSSHYAWAIKLIKRSVKAAG